MPWKRGQQLHQVTPEEACLDAAAIYAEMESALGIPLIDKLHQAYGVFPEFLKAHWDRAGKVVSSQQFFQCADRLGADAFTRAHSYLSAPDIDRELDSAKVSEASRREIMECVELFHQNSTYSLMLCAWQRLAFEGPVGNGVPREVSRKKEDRPIPIIMKPDAMPAETKKTLEEIRKRCEEPLQDPFYVAIARWPDLLGVFWQNLQVQMNSPMYDNCKEEIRKYAEQLCEELPGPYELTTMQLLDVMDESEIGSMVRITEAFERSLSALVLNVAWTKIGMEGGNSAHKSRKRISEEPTANTAD